MKVRNSNGNSATRLEMGYIGLMISPIIVGAFAAAIGFLCIICTDVGAQEHILIASDGSIMEAATSTEMPSADQSDHSDLRSDPNNDLRADLNADLRADDEENLTQRMVVIMAQLAENASPRIDPTKITEDRVHQAVRQFLAGEAVDAKIFPWWKGHGKIDFEELYVYRTPEGIRLTDRQMYMFIESGENPRWQKRNITFEDEDPVYQVGRKIDEAELR